MGDCENPTMVTEINAIVNTIFFIVLYFGWNQMSKKSPPYEYTDCILYSTDYILYWYGKIFYPKINNGI